MQPVPNFDDYFMDVKKAPPKPFKDVDRVDYRWWVPMPDSDSDDDEDADKKDGEKAGKEEEKEEPIPEPDVWPCGICTVENPMSVSTCECCLQGTRPSREELIAAI